MASRKLTDLDPELQEIAEEFLIQCAEAGIDVLIYCTYRSNEEQDKEYARGRTVSSGIAVSKRKPLGATVTKLKGGKSKHNVMVDGKPASRAFDCVPQKGGVAQWGNLVAYEKMGEIGRGLGLTCGMDWQDADTPHFQLDKV